MQLTAPFVVTLLLTLSGFVLAQETTTEFPASTIVDDSATTVPSESKQDVTTVQTTVSIQASTDAEEVEARTESSVDDQSTIDGEEPTTTESDEKGVTDVTQPTTEEDSATTTEAAEHFGREDTRMGESARLAIKESEKIKKEHVDEVNNATVERKPVHEPPFIKKYWPLLCFKTKCDRKHSSPVIPDVNTDEIRTDLEESRSSGEILRAIEAEMVESAPATTTAEPMTTVDDSSEEDKPEQANKVETSDDDDDED